MPRDMKHHIQTRSHCQDRIDSIIVVINSMNNYYMVGRVNKSIHAELAYRLLDKLRKEVRGKERGHHKGCRSCKRKAKECFDYTCGINNEIYY